MHAVCLLGGVSVKLGPSCPRLARVCSFSLQVFGQWLLASHSPVLRVFGDGGGALSLRVWRWRSPCGRGVGTRLEFRVNLLRGLMCTRLGSTDASAYALPVAVASKQTHVWFADEVEERREDAISLQLFRIPWTFNIIRSSRIREFPRDKPFSTPLIAVEQDTLLQDASTHKFVQLHLRRPKNLGEVAAPR